MCSFPLHNSTQKFIIIEQFTILIQQPPFLHHQSMCASPLNNSTSPFPLTILHLLFLYNTLLAAIYVFQSIGNAPKEYSRGAGSRIDSERHKRHDRGAVRPAASRHPRGQGSCRRGRPKKILTMRIPSKARSKFTSAVHTPSLRGYTKQPVKILRGFKLHSC